MSWRPWFRRYGSCEVIGAIRTESKSRTSSRFHVTLMEKSDEYLTFSMADADARFLRDALLRAYPKRKGRP